MRGAASLIMRSVQVPRRMGIENLSYYLYRLAGALAPRIPPRTGYALAEQIGSLIYRTSGTRRIVEDNVAHVLELPAVSPQVRLTAHRIFRNQLKNYYDLFRVEALSHERIRQLVRVTVCREHLDMALTRGRGVVLVSAHFGNIDLAGQILALLGYRVTGVAEHLRPERLFQYVRAIRESHGLHFLPIDGSLRPVFRALHNNEIVGLALDRNVTDAGLPVEFFGLPEPMPDGYLRLALRTGASLVVAFSRRLPDNAFEITVEPEVELERGGDDVERDIAAGQRRVIAIFERYLRRDPDQWVYFQPVWTGAEGKRRVTEAPSVLEETAR